MAAGAAGGGAGSALAVNAAERKSFQQPFAEMDFQESPGSHILWFLLHPENRRAFAVIGQRHFQRMPRQRVELLDSHDRHIRFVYLLALLLQFVIDFAGAEQHASVFVGKPRGGFGEYAVEASAGKLGEGRDAFFATQEALGRHDHQRLAPGTNHLAAQQVEILRRRRGERAETTSWRVLKLATRRQDGGACFSA